jgi:prepilin-type N-terminal cleavage/methylation domain-containing protein
MRYRTIETRRGFTLLEVLIASSILAMIFAMVMGAYTGLLSSGRGVRASADTNQVARYIVRKMTEDLQSASLLKNNTEPLFYGKHKKANKRGADSILLTGFGRRLLFTGSNADQAEIGWSVEKGARPSDLYRLFRTENANITGFRRFADKAEKLPVTDRLYSFDLEYYYKKKYEKSFDSKLTKKLPEGVRLHFELVDTEGRRIKRSALISVGGLS